MDLLERDHCLHHLSELLHLATTGQGRTVLISGEAGIGKTALVEHFVHQQREATGHLWGVCEALFTPRPLGPLHDMATQLGGRLAELLRSTPERATLFHAVLAELQQRPAPTIVVFEDVHWADEATLDLIKFLGRRISHLPVLFLVTYRDPELSADHPLHSVIGDLPRNAVTQLRLAPLSEQAVISLARQAQRSATGLYAVTLGNPFFVSEVLASEVEGVPLMVRDAVLARIARFSSTARTLLELISVVPTRIERWLLEAVLGLATSALEECLRGGILSLDHATVAFRHELARQAVESTLSPLRRQSLHTQVLQALITHRQDVFPAARLVHHALGAGDGAQVIHYAPLAAKQAAAQGAHREAAAHYATALRFANQFSLEQQADLLEGRSYECYLTNLMEEALQARLSALQMWRQLDRSAKVGQSLRWLSRLHWFLGHAAEAQRYAVEAVELLETLPADEHLAMAYSNRAQLAMLAGQTAETVHWGERAIRLADKLGDIQTLIHALNNVGTVLILMQDKQGQSYMQWGLHLALECGWEEHIIRAYVNFAYCLVWCRDYPLAEQLLQEGLAYCAEHDLDAWGTYLGVLRAQTSFEQGDWDEAVTEAMCVLKQPHLPVAARVPALVVLGRIQTRRGDPNSETLLDEARDLALATGEVQRIAPVTVARAERAWLQGDREQCLAECRGGYDLAVKHGHPWLLGELSIWMWRAGEVSFTSQTVAEPFARQMAGDWRGSAELWARLGCPYEQALALAEGDVSAQFEALTLFEQLGALSAAALVRRQLRRKRIVGIPRGVIHSTRANQAGLTNRQMEVFRLMAQGLSNAEIATRLFTSPKTIENHAAAIFAKLGVRSRAQVIRIAQQESIVPNDQSAVP